MLFINNGVCIMIQRLTDIKNILLDIVAFNIGCDDKSTDITIKSGYMLTGDDGTKYWLAIESGKIILTVESDDISLYQTAE